MINILVVEDDIKPSDILTQESFNNAIAVDMALGGSSNTALHIPAIASEVDGIDVDLELFDEISNYIERDLKSMGAEFTDYTGMMD